MHRFRNTFLATASMAVLVVGLGACGRDSRDLVKGKAAFVQQCGGCHTLARAGTKGTQGPNLDHAFVSDRKDGMTAKTVEGVVKRQIAHPRRGSILPANLVKGAPADAGAAYVGFAAGIPGQDQGPLAQAGAPTANNKPITAQGGKLTIPAVGGTAFASTAATAKAGKVTVDMPNKTPLQHNIALKGVAGAAGKIVSQGQTSSFTVTLKPGKYTFFCEVPGHEAAGMKGTLTVK